MSPAPKRDRRSSRGGSSRGRAASSASGRGQGQRGGQRGGQRSNQSRSPGRTQRPPDLGGDQVEGRRSVLELLEADRRPVIKVMIAGEQDGSEHLDRIEALCQQRRVVVEVVSRSRLEREAGTESHQGVIAKTRPLKPLDLEELMMNEGDRPPFLLVCDGVTDPHNLGSLLRSAECAGVTGIVLPRHRSARVTPTVTKVAAGAVEYLRFSLVAGIPTALDQLSKAGIEVVGLAGEARQSLFDLPINDTPIALVVGSEEKGLAQLSRKRCTQLASIPHVGALESLNASVAGAVAIFEVARQRATR